MLHYLESDILSDFERNPEVKPTKVYITGLVWNLEKVHAKGIDGDGITIAVLDSSINKNHKAFSGNTLSGKNFLEEGKDDYWYSNRELHGTMVAGIVAKHAPKAKIYLCCVSDKGYKADAVNKALKHLMDKKECPHVIIMSFGRYQEKAEDEREGIINELYSKRGVICVAAAGNQGLFGGKQPSPACFDNTIVAGGLNKFGYPADFNSPGNIDVYAPGEKVLYPSHDNNHTYCEGGGTSCAAPAIGAIVALLIQCAHRSGVRVNNIHLLKDIFDSKEMKPAVDVNGKNVKLFNPKKFFEEYGTPEKFRSFIEKIKWKGSS